MPPKKAKKPRKRRAPTTKKGLKQKQKQKQEQKVNVSVSAGGSGGGGTQFIPMPQAPAFDYAQLANLIRPAATVDVPIRAQANPESMVASAPEAKSLKELTSKQLRFSEGEPEEIEFESMPEYIAPKADIKTRKQRGPYGSTKEKYTNVGRNIQNVFAMGAMGTNPYSSEPETTKKTGVMSFGELTGGGSSSFV